MEYVLEYRGGPSDGGRESSPYGKGYQTLTIKVFREHNVEIGFIYGFKQSIKSETVIKRIYDFLEKLPVQEAVEFIGQHSRSCWEEEGEA